MSTKSLYRYRTINKYSIKALMNDEIYATTPNNFNDPYDVIFLYDTEELVKLILSDEELLRNIYSELDHEDLYTFSFESFYFYIKSTPSIFYSAIEILMNNAIKLFRKKHLIACFSENNKSEIMWAHYSNFGTGFVIKYDSNDLKNMCSEYLQKIDKNLFENSDDKKQYGCFPVNYYGKKLNGTNLGYKIIKAYFNSRQDYHNGKITRMKYTHLSNEDFKTITLNKMKAWEYEKEERIILPNDNEINDSALIGYCRPRAVYIGEFMELHNKYLILNICKQKHIPVYHMESSLSTKLFGLQEIKYTNEEIDMILNELVNEEKKIQVA